MKSSTSIHLDLMQAHPAIAERLRVAKIILDEADLDCSVSSASAEAFGAELDAASATYAALTSSAPGAIESWQGAIENWQGAMDALVAAIDVDCGVSSCSRETYGSLLDAYERSRPAGRVTETAAAGEPPRRKARP